MKALLYDVVSLVQAAGFEVTRRVQLLDGLAEELTALPVKGGHAS